MKCKEIRRVNGSEEEGEELKERMEKKISKSVREERGLREPEIWRIKVLGMEEFMEIKEKGRKREFVYVFGIRGQEQEWK